MSTRFVRDAVSEYSDRGVVSETVSIGSSSAERKELESLFTVIRALRIVLAPVEPSPEFAALLRAELMAASFAAARTGGRSVFRMVIGAVAVSSLVSVAALYVYNRTRPPRRAA